MLMITIHSAMIANTTESVAMVFLPSNDLSPRCLSEVSLVFLRYGVHESMLFLGLLLFFALFVVVVTRSAVVVAT